MNDKQDFARTLKQLNVKSKVDENNREVHQVTCVIELLDNKDRSKLHHIAKHLAKPIRVEFDPVQLELN
jgi:hypothetical protein